MPTLSEVSVAQLPTEHSFEPPPGQGGSPSDTLGGGTRLLEETLKINFEPPPGQGAPSETLGGASRGPQCLPHELPLRVLVPETIQGVKYGLTVEASPTFFVYIPETVATQIEFIVTDNQPYPHGKIIDERVLDIPTKPGVMKINLQGNLEPNQYYEWAVYLKCPGIPVTDAFSLPSSGWIKRVILEEDVQQKVTQSSHLEQAQIYAERGIWFDSLAQLYQQVQKTPDNATLRGSWFQFLNSEITDLDPEIRQTPLIDCCTP